jgi:hypothetical protein
MTDLEAMKAAFLAKGGTVSKVAEGEGLNLSPREWHKVNTGECTQYARGASERAQADREAQDERKREAYRAVRLDGGSESEALDYMRRAR